MCKIGNDDQRSPNRNINEVKEQYEYGYLRHIIDSRKDQDQSITQTQHPTDPTHHSFEVTQHHSSNDSIYRDTRYIDEPRDGNENFPKERETKILLS